MIPSAGRTRGVVLLLAALGGVATPPSAAAQDWKEVTLTRRAEDLTELDVRITYMAGRLRVASGSADLLYAMRLRYEEGKQAPVAVLEGDHLHLGLDRVSGDRGRGKRGGSELDLELSGETPMRLAMEFGAVLADIDLGGLSLTGLDLHTGAADSRVEISRPNRVAMERAVMRAGAAEFQAEGLGNLNAGRIDVDAGLGRLTLDFSGDWQQDAQVSVGLALGALVLRFPEGLGVRLRRDSILTSFDSEGLVKRGEWYYSPDWENAEHKVTLELDAKFGTIAVEWIG